jgi:hypothetical protein
LKEASVVLEAVSVLTFWCLLLVLAKTVVLLIINKLANRPTDNFFINKPSIKNKNAQAILGILKGFSL